MVLEHADCQYLPPPPPQQKKKAHYCSQDQVYDFPLRPILVEASILPAKAGTAKPVITRFYLPEATEGVCAEEGGGGRGGGTGSGWARVGTRVNSLKGPKQYSFPVNEDLMRMNYVTKMREQSQKDKVQSFWSFNGQLRLKLHNSPRYPQAQFCV